MFKLAEPPLNVNVNFCVDCYIFIFHCFFFLFAEMSGWRGLLPGHVLQQDEQPLRQDCHVSALLQQEQGGRVQEWVLPGPLLSRGLYSTHPQVPRYRIELYSAHPIQPTRILVLIKGTIPRDFWPPVFNHSNQLGPLTTSDQCVIIVSILVTFSPSYSNFSIEKNKFHPRDYQTTSTNITKI